jgi:signal transduction histidine kinase
MRDSDFLSIVSHELRTPITVIVGLAATLANRRERLTQEQVDDCLEQVLVNLLTNAYRYGGPTVRLEHMRMPIRCS